MTSPSDATVTWDAHPYCPVCREVKGRTIPVTLSAFDIPHMPTRVWVEAHCSEECERVAESQRALEVLAESS